MMPHSMRLKVSLWNSRSIVLSLCLAVLGSSQGIAGQGLAGLGAEVHAKGLRKCVAEASSDQDPRGQDQASQAQAPQPSPSPQVQAGQALFAAQCGFCHGRDAAGGETGPDLTSSEIVEKDVGGNEIGPVVRTGRSDRGMPQFNLTDADLAAIVAFLHEEKAKAESRPGRRRNVQPEDLQTGNADEGRNYFNGAGGCSKCHSPTGDLAGVANRLRGLALLQRMLYPKPRKSDPPDSPATVTVTLPAGQTVTGKLAYQDEFVIGVTDSSGWYRSWFKSGVKFRVVNPLEAHSEQLGKYTDETMHNVLAYLQTLR
jgi:cytochrome c oxidase cbb3-type subunit 3